MARKRRVFLPNVSVHVIQRGNNRGAVFGEHRDYAHFLDLLKLAASFHAVDVHAFTLMTTHVHVLATPQNAAALPGMMKDGCGQYAQYFNRTYSRIGTVWNGRYKPRPVDDERYWLNCLRYIERNPVEAGIVTDPRDYRWSSYRVHAYGEESSWLTPHPLYLALGSTPEMRQAAYRAICLGSDPRQLQTIRPRGAFRAAPSPHRTGEQTSPPGSRS